MKDIHFSVEELSKIVNGDIIGNKNIYINKLTSIENAKNGDLSVIHTEGYLKYIAKSKASAIIIDKKLKIPKKRNNLSYIIVDNAYLTFCILLEKFYEIDKFSRSGIENPSFIHNTVKFKDGFYLGAFSYIDSNCKIDKNVKIYPNSYVGENVSIGKNTLIYPGVTINNNSKIGSNCTLHSGAIIGSDGFGFLPDSNGSYKRIPQVGDVIIKNNVNIGANTVIDKATLESTIINEGVKLDNLIQIGHNVEIGKNTVIAAQSGISGSTKVGKNSLFGGQVGVIGHLNLGENIKYAAQSGVSKNIKSDETVFGSPAINRRKYIQSYSIFKKLPEVEKRIKEIEKKLLKLQKLSL
tara:strand:+ start:444 stop:1499 length:1056 start_codon:yes stop_codon:yes gene_type:complete